MSEVKYLSKDELSYFLKKLKETFGIKSTVDTARSALDTYILNIDYSALEFNTGLIVSGSATSATLGTATLGTMVLGNP